MSINTDEIVVGGYYLAGENCDQLRKVTEIISSEPGRKRIIYEAKSKKIPGRTFGRQGTLANPALEGTFAKSCCKKLTLEEIEKLRNDNIILTGE